jgi:hypothetical protein
MYVTFIIIGSENVDTGNITTILTRGWCGALVCIDALWARRRRARLMEMISVWDFAGQTPLASCFGFTEVDALLRVDVEALAAMATIREERRPIPYWEVGLGQR